MAVLQDTGAIKLIGAIVALVGIGFTAGFLPKCGSLQTTAQAAEEHRGLSEKAESVKLELSGEIGDLERRNEKTHDEIKAELKEHRQTMQRNQAEIMRLLRPISRRLR